MKINGYDAYEMWGVVLEQGSYEKLLSGETMKPYTENTSRSIDGKLVSIKNPRLDERNVILTFNFTEQEVSLLTRMKSFLGVLKSGLIELNVPELNSTYRLIYKSSNNVVQAQLKIAKINVVFNEPNPADR